MTSCIRKSIWKKLNACDEIDNVIQIYMIINVYFVQVIGIQHDLWMLPK